MRPAIQLLQKSLKFIVSSFSWTLSNPKAYNIDMTPKANPYEAFRNPEMREQSFSQTIGNAFANLLGQKKAN